MNRYRPTQRAWLFAIALLLILPACSSDSGLDTRPTAPNPSPPGPADEIVGNVSVNGTNGSYVAGATLPGTTGGALAKPSILGSSQYISGSPILIQVTVEDTATELWVGISNTSEGYYTVPLSGLPKDGAVQSDGNYTPERLEAFRHKLSVSRQRQNPQMALAALQTFTLTIEPAVDPVRTAFTVLVSAHDGTNTSDPAAHSLAANSTAQSSGFLQVSLNFVHPVDLDLHVQTPNDEIYWGNDTGSSGGILDLDSNAACFLDYVNNENITWLGTQPLAGTYVVRVDLWSACEEAGPFPYIVSVIVGGQQTLYQGEMTVADADGGSVGSGREITTFTIAP